MLLLLPCFLLIQMNHSLMLLVLLPVIHGHGFHGPGLPHFNYLSYGYSEQELQEYKDITVRELCKME